MRRSDAFLQFIQSLNIRGQNLQILPLAFKPAQHMIWDKLAARIDARAKVWAIILKARREGVSTLCESLLLARASIEDYVHALVMGSNAGNTQEIWRMSQTMVDHSPLKKYAKKVFKEIHLRNSKIIIATAGSPDATRGFDLTCLHGSEVAFWPDKDTLLAALQCLPEHVDTFCFLESTANGKVGIGEQFYEEWGRAVEGDSDFVPIFLPWFVMPEYSRPGYLFKDDWTKGMPSELVLERLDDEEEELVKQFHLTAPQLSWRRWAIKNRCQGDLERFNQEFPATAEMAFIQSGRPFFSRSALLPFQSQIEAGRKYRIQGVELHSDPTGYVEIWKEPIDGHQYVIGADSSLGCALADARERNREKKTHSRSAAEVIDMDTLEQVAEYELPSPPHMFARHLVALAKRYNQALIAPEVNASGGGGGREVIIYIKEQQYWNMHIWRNPDRIAREQGCLYGWETNARSRPRMLSRIREVVDERSCTIHSEKLYRQLFSFGESDENRYEALAGYDDLLFAWGIGLCSRSENYIAKRFATKEILGDKYDLARWGLNIKEWDVSEALAAHKKKVLTPAGPGEPDSYMEL